MQKTLLMPVVMVLVVFIGANTAAAVLMQCMVIYDEAY